MQDALFFERCRDRVARTDAAAPWGRIVASVGRVLQAEGLRARIGSICRVEPVRATLPSRSTGSTQPGEPLDGSASFTAEVIGFREGRFLLMPLGESGGVGPHARIRVIRDLPDVVAGDACLGRVLDGLGEPLDGGPPILGTRVPLYGASDPPLARRRIQEPLDVGVRAINGLLTLARGGRFGIFAGSGVGKSTLLGEIARRTHADVNVIALVGERGRELREFIERDLGDALERSVVVVATSDEAPLLRVRAAHVATAIAEEQRSKGRQVLLLMDSLTRFAAAQREIGLAAGEPPATRGYPPSLWSALPRLLERAGTAREGGSITGIYTVLVEGDDPQEPVADAARSLLDGHVVLSRELAERGLFPAVDVLSSISRVMNDVTSEEHRRSAIALRELLATRRRVEDLVSIGAYRAGSDPQVDRALALGNAIDGWLHARAETGEDLAATRAALAALVSMRAPGAAA